MALQATHGYESLVGQAFSLQPGFCPARGAERGGSPEGLPTTFTGEVLKCL